MVPKKDAKHGIGLSLHRIIDTMSGVLIDAMPGVKKAVQTVHAINHPTSQIEPLLAACLASYLTPYALNKTDILCM